MIDINNPVKIDKPITRPASECYWITQATIDKVVDIGDIKIIPAGRNGNSCTVEVRLRLYDLPEGRRYIASASATCKGYNYNLQADALAKALVKLGVPDDGRLDSGIDYAIQKLKVALKELGVPGIIFVAGLDHTVEG